MKAKISTYLKNQKKYLKNIVEELSSKFSYVSILGTDTVGTRYGVSKKESSVSDSNWAERGFVIRVFNGVNYSEYSFNDLSKQKEIIDSVIELVKNDIVALKDQGLELIEFPLIEEEEITDNFYSEFEIDPFTISAEKKISELTDLMKEGFSLCDKFVDFRTSYEEVKISKVFLSTKKDLEQSILYTNMSLAGIAVNEKGMKYDFQGLSGLKGFEIFKEAKEKLQVVADSVKELLNAERVKPGEYEVICDPDVSGLIAHEAFGHGVEMDMFVKNRAKGVEYINKPVASKITGMRDGAKSDVEMGTYLFDDEGTLGTDTVVIENGILKNGISDLLSALKLGTTPTGNGRRESFERKAYARMTNTFFESGSNTLDEMIQSIKYGYLLEGYFSGMEDPKNWGIQCVLAKGKEIIDGKLTGKIISPVTLTGFVPDLLKSISMVSDGKVKLSGGGACGKGYKEWVKVSSGGTYLKAIGRLS